MALSSVLTGFLEMNVMLKLGLMCECLVTDFPDSLAVDSGNSSHGGYSMITFLQTSDWS